MKVLCELIVAILMPRRASRPVRFELSKAQQKHVLKQCRELNLLIQEVHDNLSDIRAAGSATSRLTKETHANKLRGSKKLRQQQAECERINDELKKVSEEMRAVRKNVALASQKTILTVNKVKHLEDKVTHMSARQECSSDLPGSQDIGAEVVSLSRYKR